MAVAIWRGDEVQEAAVGVVQSEPALTPATRNPASSCGLVERMGSTTAVFGGSGQGPGGTEPETERRGRRRPGAPASASPPPAAKPPPLSLEVNDSRADRFALGNPCGRRPGVRACRLAPSGRAGRTGTSLPCASRVLRRDGARLFRRLRLGGAAAQVTQRRPCGARPRPSSVIS